MAEQPNARVDTWQAIQAEAPDLAALMTRLHQDGVRPRMLGMASQGQRHWPPTEMLWTRQDLADLKWAKAQGE